MWTVNDVLNWSIPLELSRFIPFYWVDPYSFIILGMDRLNERVWIDSRRHWRSTLYNNDTDLLNGPITPINNVEKAIIIFRAENILWEVHSRSRIIGLFLNRHLCRLYSYQLHERSNTFNLAWHFQKFVKCRIIFFFLSHFCRNW